jgi:hypothetical protein
VGVEQKISDLVLTHEFDFVANLFDYLDHGATSLAKLDSPIGIAGKA